MSESDSDSAWAEFMNAELSALENERGEVEKLRKKVEQLRLKNRALPPAIIKSPFGTGFWIVVAFYALCAIYAFSHPISHSDSDEAVYADEY